MCVDVGCLVQGVKIVRDVLARINDSRSGSGECCMKEEWLRVGCLCHRGPDSIGGETVCAAAIPPDAPS